MNDVKLLLEEQVISRTKLNLSEFKFKLFHRTSDFPQRPPGEEAAKVRRRDRIAAGGQETGDFEIFCAKFCVKIVCANLFIIFSSTGIRLEGARGP